MICNICSPDTYLVLYTFAKYIDIPHSLVLIDQWHSFYIKKCIFCCFLYLIIGMWFSRYFERIISVSEYKRISLVKIRRYECSSWLEYTIDFLKKFLKSSDVFKKEKRHREVDTFIIERDMFTSVSTNLFNLTGTKEFEHIF